MLPSFCSCRRCWERRKNLIVSCPALSNNSMYSEFDKTERKDSDDYVVNLIWDVWFIVSHERKSRKTRFNFNYNILRKRIIHVTNYRESIQVVSADPQQLLMESCLYILGVAESDQVKLFIIGGFWEATHQM